MQKLYWDIAPFLKKEERPFNQHEWKCGGGFAQTYCHNDKNCLYKQLKRKEQECFNALLKLSKAEQAIDSIEHVLEVYFDDDNRATREIQNIIDKTKKNN